MKAGTFRPPTFNFARGLNQYSLDTLHDMSRDYKRAVRGGKNDTWTLGRMDALTREIYRRSGDRDHDSHDETTYQEQP